MAEAVGVAVIGTGMWARRVMPTLKRTHAFQLVTCYSRDEERRQTFARDFDCQAAPYFEAAVESNQVQAVLLFTPNHVHAQQAIACARSGKHVFVEKPIAYSIAEGKAMQEACMEASVTLFVGHCFRKLGAARRVKELLEAGVLGQVVLVEANFSLPSQLTPDKWRFYRYTCPGGPLMQLGIHHADTLQYWLGPVKRVQGSLARLATRAEIDDVGAAVLEFETGARGTLTSSYVSPKTYTLRLYGTRGNVDYHTDMSVWPDAAQMDQATTLTFQSPAGRETLDFDRRDMLEDELEEFARCVRGETQPETRAEQGLMALKVILAAIESAENGEVVSL